MKTFYYSLIFAALFGTKSLTSSQLAEEIAASVRKEAPEIAQDIQLEVGRGRTPFISNRSDELERGGVRLRGVVQSSKERERIGSLVSETPGVTFVVNDLVIGTPPHVLRQQRMQNFIKNVQSTGLIGQYDIRPVLEGSTLTLYGTISNPHEREVVEKLAQKVPGLTEVVNNLVLFPIITDDRIRNDVLKALKSSERDVRGLTLNVRQGVVLVSGDRPSHELIDELLSTIIMVDGVQDIDSRITINGRPY